MLKIFIDNQWIEYNYEYLYTHYGYTDSVSLNITLYDDNHDLLEAWENNHLVWVQKDTFWYPYEELPYYKDTSRTVTQYKIDQASTFPIFTKQGREYIYYDNYFTTLSDIQDTLGYSDTPSTVWGIDQGVPWSWYNEDLDQYWDDRVGKKSWSSIPPEPEQEDEGGVPTYPDPFVPLPQWENDLSQVPTIWSRSGNYYPPEEDQTLYTVFRDWPTWEDCQNLFNERLYPDRNEYDITFYVYSVDGVDDYAGVHHNQGDTFIGDQQSVWVESDDDVDFYKGTQHFVYGQTHDDNHSELFYIEPDFFTPTQMHNMGYTRTQGQDVEIWDMNLMGIH